MLVELQRKRFKEMDIKLEQFNVKLEALTKRDYKRQVQIS